MHFAILSNIFHRAALSSGQKLDSGLRIRLELDSGLRIRLEGIHSPALGRLWEQTVQLIRDPFAIPSAPFPPLKVRVWGFGVSVWGSGFGVLVFGFVL